MRESGVWTYGLVNLTHILGVSSLFGSVLVLDLRLLGLWRGVPLDAMAGPLVRVAGAGLAVALVSGAGLITTNATEYQGNPFLPIKLAAVALGLANVAVLSRLPAWTEKAERPLTAREDRQLAVSGGVSLVCWLVAVGAGRLIGYW